MTAEESTGGPLRFTLPRSRRIARSGDFRRVYAMRASAADDHLVVYACANGLPFSRMGVSVGRKHGGSVRRNALKRRLREAFRLSRHRLPEGYDFILIPRGGPLAAPADLQAALVHLARRAADRAGRKEAAARSGENGA